MSVSDADANITALRLTREEGLLVGVSAGANVFAALQIAEELGPTKRVVTVLPRRDVCADGRALEAPVGRLAQVRAAELQGVVELDAPPFEIRVHDRALERSAGGEAVNEAVLRDVSRAAADVGISPDAAEAGEIARRLAEVELGR